MVTFTYKCQNITIQCNKSDKMKDIIDKFITKTQIDKNSVYYLYNGTLIINEDLEVGKVIKDENKNEIIVYNLSSDNNNNNSIIISKDIICPKCKEKAIIKIKDYKIELYNCKNGHNVKDILINEYEKTQVFDISSLKCNNCDKNKSNTYNNEFYRCVDCKINLCPLCRSIHEKTQHYIIIYEMKDYTCEMHKETFVNIVINVKGTCVFHVLLSIKDIAIFHMKIFYQT